MHMQLRAQSVVQNNNVLANILVDRRAQPVRRNAPGAAVGVLAVVVH